jgi:hypothetical protein
MSYEGGAGDGHIDIPRFALVPRGKQRVKGRVLSYEGNGYFTVLIPGDIKVFMHRDRLIFANK